MEFQWWQAVLLGLVQGATEFLPVSSSGHLALFRQLLGLELPGVTFEVVVHLGTLLAVLAVYRREIYLITVSLLRGLPDLTAGPAGRRDFWRNPHSRWAVLLVLGSLPAAAAGLLLKDTVAALFSSLRAVGYAWLVTGLLLLTADRAMARRARAGGGRIRDGDGRAGGLVDDQLRPGHALLMGVLQALALLPGISRSGSTITAGVVSGLAPATAARFSFLLSIPTILGAGLLDLADTVTGSGPPLPANALAAGFAAAALSGYGAIRLLLTALAAGRLRPFAFYCWTLAAVVLVVSRG